MATDVSFEINLNEIVTGIYGKVEDRNDLVTVIQNGTSLTLDLTWVVSNGDFHSVVGPTVLDGPTGDPPAASYSAIAVDAAGAGSNIIFTIVSGQDVWFVNIVCPPNGENSFTYSYGIKTPNFFPTIQYAGPQIYSNSGPMTYSGTSTASGTQVSICVTNTSPATCQIQFISTS